MHLSGKHVQGPGFHPEHYKKKAHGKSNSFRESTEIPGEPILGTKKEGTA